MIWSISKSKIFLECPRKWFFMDSVANSRSKDPLKKEAFYLKQLCSLYAWRGNLVDHVIETKIVPSLRIKKIPLEEEVISYTRQLANDQLEFGLAQKYREKGMTKTNAGLNYCAFYDIEYNGGLKEENFQYALKEAETSLSNLLSSDIVNSLVQSNLYLIPQRTLHHSMIDFHITCTPDLIVFYNERPPLIIDWKVHSGRNTDYWLQLGVYSYILSRTKPHKDFPTRFSALVSDSKEIELIEFQLLQNKIKRYKLTEQDICDIEDYIYKTGKIMKYAEEINEDEIKNYSTSNYASSCKICQFKKLCFQGEEYAKSN